MSSLKLLRIDNVYYIELDGERIAIEEWEAGNRNCPPYVVELIAYRVQHDAIIPRRKTKKPEA